LLVVDASQGVEAQTVANCYTAIEQGVEVVPVLNKIDLPSANPEGAIQEIEDVIGIKASDALLVSAKTGQGVEEVLEAVIHRMPPPKGDPAAPLKALIIDSWFDNYVGVIMLVRLVDGIIRPKDKLLLMSTQAVHLCEQVGVFTPKSQSREQLSAGEVGFVTAGVRELQHARVGDTITLVNRPAATPLPGFKEIKPQCLPALSGGGKRVRGVAGRAGEAQAQRRLPALRAETSQASASDSAAASSASCTWISCRNGLKGEYEMALVTTAPTVVYEVLLRDGTVARIENPAKMRIPRKSKRFASRSSKRSFSCRRNTSERS